MTRICRRILCVALAVLMLSALLPASLEGTTASADDVVLGLTIKWGVNVRKGPSMNDDTVCKLQEKNTVCVVLRELDANNYHWFEVVATDPESKTGRQYDGFIRGDCFRLLSAEESAKYGSTYTAVPAPNITPKPDNTANPSSGEGSGSSVVTAPPNSASDAAPAGTTGTINAWGVNFRILPNKEIIKRLDKGTVVNVLSIPEVVSRSTWYKVELDGITGYIMSVYLTLNNAPAPGTPTPTPQPGDPTPTPTVAPTTAPQPDGDALGYVKTIKGSVNVRASIGGTVITTVARWQTFPYLLTPVKRGNYTWYFVRLPNGIQGYIRGDCVKVVPAPAPADPTPTPTATAQPVVTATPVPGVITPTPVPADVPTGYVKTTMSDVNIRKGPAGDKIGLAKKKGTVYPYYGEPTQVGKVKWYKIYDASFSTVDHFAYIHGNYVTLCDPGGDPVTPTPAPATPTPTTTAAPDPTPTPQQGGYNEADYTTLRPGSSGTAVKTLVSELKNQGYYTGEVTNSYTSAVENAVRAFQTAKGLAVDGIAGKNTQHALFNTVPIGTADRNNLTMTIYPAEKIDWNTGGIQELWPRGSNFKVYDLWTKTVFWAHRWAGGLHMDIEPLTRQDTDRICSMYGVSSADQIVESKHWQRRPCLVTIGTRTFACSLYGVPHNYPDGDTIADNDFKGQMCLHFTNSKGHESKKVDSKHQAAIEEAWLNAPNGHK